MAHFASQTRPNGTNCRLPIREILRFLATNLYVVWTNLFVQNNACEEGVSVDYLA